MSEDLQGCRYSVVPDYYRDFKCIAGACRHTCCAHWEIDIDPESLERFQRDKLDHISTEGDPHFILQDDRCPYLKADGLCDLIIRYGEDYLCDICRDHPRFRNFWTGTVEMGLGLCCEAAAELILGRTEPMELLFTDTETGEEVSFDDVYESLPEDEQYLFDLRDSCLMEASGIEDPLEARLTEYFLYRQLPDALYDGLLEERLRFVRESVSCILKAAEPEDPDRFQKVCEAARAYSDEIEYDTEKLEELLNNYTDDTGAEA